MRLEQKERNQGYTWITTVSFDFNEPVGSDENINLILIRPCRQATEVKCVLYLVIRCER